MLNTDLDGGCDQHCHRPSEVYDTHRRTTLTAFQGYWSKIGRQTDRITTPKTALSIARAVKMVHLHLECPFKQPDSYFLFCFIFITYTYHTLSPVDILSLSLSSIGVLNCMSKVSVVCMFGAALY